MGLIGIWRNASTSLNIFFKTTAKCLFLSSLTKSPRFIQAEILLFDSTNVYRVLAILEIKPGTKLNQILEPSEIIKYWRRETVDQ